MVLQSVLVTGSNRGIGLEMIRQLASGHAPFGLPRHIFACCREPTKAEDLKRIAQEATSGSEVHIVKLEVTDDKQIGDTVKIVESVVGNAGLNLLINNAAIIHREGSMVNAVDRKVFMDHMNANVASPLMITQAFLPLLRLASTHVQGDKLSIDRAAVVNMSSGAGSLAMSHPCNTKIGFGYRVSKAALNMVTKCLETDLKQEPVLFVSMSPGWVKTDMGGQDAPLTVEESVADLFTTMTRLNEEHNGGFFRKDGSAIPF